MVNLDYKLIRPNQTGTGNYHVIVNHPSQSDTSSAQAGSSQVQTINRPCVSYDKLIAFLNERTQKNTKEHTIYITELGNITLGPKESKAVADYLSKNPAAADLARDFLSNSCGDIGQLIANISSSRRDAAVIQGLDTASQNLLTGISVASRDFREIVQYGSSELSGIAYKFEKGAIEASLIVAAATLIAAGTYVAGRMIGRR